jgi:hypothetical protein
VPLRGTIYFEIKRIRSIPILLNLKLITRTDESEHSSTKDKTFTMIYIYNQKTSSGFSGELETFRILYESAFPDPNEREEFKTILKRIAEKPYDDNPYTFIILTTSENKTGSVVSGGLIADWYEGCSAIHLTYLVVSPEFRGNKIGSALIKTGISDIKKIISKEHGIELKHLFFESNIPWIPRIDSFKPETRLLIFHKLGAKWIDIPYVQPPLDQTKQRVRSLFLLVFPDDSSTDQGVKSDEAAEFLKNLYRGLGIKVPENDPDFINMINSLNESSDENGCLLLKSIPGEFPKYKISRASVTYHLIEDPELQEGSSETANKKSNTAQGSETCSRFFSYENDLMNFQSQWSPPFTTVLKTECKDYQVTIKYPEHYSFTSEGRKNLIFTNRAEVTANMAVSSTIFRNSKIRIWHITLTPGVNGNFFTEYDIIKLSSYFGSLQENSEIKNNIKFKPAGSDKWSFLEDIVGHYGFTKPGVQLRPTKTGIIQIETNEFRFPEQGLDLLFDKFYTHFSEKSESASASLEETYSSVESFTDLLNSLCGMTLGIFDFNRMGSREVIDTLRPINVFSDSMMIIARGNLLSISKEDEILGDVYTSIGVNPYLLIPSCYLAHNEYIVSTVKKKIDSILEKPGKHVNISISDLEEVRRDSQDKLNNKYLISPFQYPTESNIVSKADQQRGIEDLVSYIKFRIEELTEQIEQRTNFRASVIEAFMTSFLLLISLLQIYSLIESWFLNKNLFRILFMLISFFSMAGFFLLVLGKNNRIINFLNKITRRRSHGKQ